MKRIIIAVIVLMFTQVTFAASVHWALENGGNGHWYELIEGPATWEEAKVAAEARKYQGITGYLATVTTQAENDFIYNNLVIDGFNVWLGGWQVNGASSPSSGWNWVTGETFSYTNWDPGEPNDGVLGGGSEDNRENWMEMRHTSGGWNDETAVTQRDYIVEYAVPEPTTISLLALGGLAMIRRRY